MRAKFALLGCLLGCKASTEAPTSTYFERVIAPTLQGSCVQLTTGCHVETPKGTALGNLDVKTFAALDRRRDLLVTYGPYPLPGLLMKVVGPQVLRIEGPTSTVSVLSDVRHAAGAGIDVTSEGFANLRRWMDAGASENNLTTNPVSASPSGPCRPSVPGTLAAGADPGAGFDTFVAEVQPVLAARCSAGSCHGHPLADFALTCGTDPTQHKWNALAAAGYLSDPIEGSELLRRTLPASAGGTYHEGGAIFTGTTDPGYVAIEKWAKARGPAKVGVDEVGFRFFADRVQPLLARRGCMFLGCHAPTMFHEYKIRGGSGGRFSLAATRLNHTESLHMMAIDAPDARVSRLLAKTTYPADPAIDALGRGIHHRGGPLFEDVVGADRATPEACVGVDAEKGDLNTIPGYCVILAWHAKERAAAIAKGMDATPLRGIVYVSRPPDADFAQAFDTYRPGAELHLLEATLDAEGRAVPGADRDLTSGCGLSAATADIRRPAVSWDAKTVAFAARSSATEPLALYTMASDGSGCAKHAFVSAHLASQDGILLHDFDPAFSPDGRLVFASTRGAIGQSSVDYVGPTRTPTDLLPNANLYVLEKKDGADFVRQMTFLLGQEIAPAFKRNGQLIFSTEKRAPGFYQLAARRQNLDGTDYHPLFGQRKSVGYEQLVDVKAMSDGNLVGIFSDRGAKGRGGALGVINRSLGPDQFDRDPSDRTFLHSLSFPDPNTTGKLGKVGTIYRGPAPLPSAWVVVSAADGADPATFAGVYGLVLVDVRSGKRAPLLDRPGRALVDAAVISARPPTAPFAPNANEFHVEPGAMDAEMRNVDLPMLASLFFDNRRGARTIPLQTAALGILESLPPPKGITSFAELDPRFVTTDAYGPAWGARRPLGVVPTFGDASIAYQIPGGVPFVLDLRASKTATPFVTQLEEGQLYPGERAKGSFRRGLFDANCGGCHGAVSGKEVDVHLRPDLITEASRAVSITAPPTNLFLPPGARGLPQPPAL
ncbi:MAG: PD40 domain-containing protein [Myxococcales bacterium]|nr:PD40 domain-containing protein [Myxococcales bacterium]